MHEQTATAFTVFVSLLIGIVNLGVLMKFIPHWHFNQLFAFAYNSTSIHAQTYIIIHCAYTKFNRPLSRRLDRCDRVIQNESRDPFCGNVYYVIMQITFLTRANSGMGNVVHITTKWVSSLTLDCNGVFAIKTYGAHYRA